MSNRIIKVISFLLLAFFFNIHLVYAHSPIEKMSPGAGDVLEKAPSQIELWFEDPVEVFQGSIIVSSEDNKQVSLEKPQFDPKDKRHVTAVLPKILSPGKYTVQIDAISSDGHHVEENYQFEIKKPILSQGELLQRFKIEKSNPGDGTIVSTSPDQIELWFTDKTNVTVFGIFDDQGTVVATSDPVQDPTNPSHFTVKIKNPLHKGTYSVHWYATVDDFEKNGIFYYVVQEYTHIKGTNGILKDSIFEHIGLLQLAHWLAFIGGLSLAGGILFELFAAKGKGNLAKWRKYSYLLYGLSTIGFIIEIIATRLEYKQVPITDFVSFPFVWITILQVIILSIGFWCLKGIFRLGLLSITVLLWAFTGHSSTPSYGGVLSIVLDGLHLLGVSVWLGGLLSLLLMLPKENPMEWLKEAGKTYSKWAIISIAVIAITGVWMSKNYIPSFSVESFLASNWGKLIVVKVVLIIEILAIGFLQMVYIKKISTSGLRFLRNLKIEFYIGAVILIIAALLIDLSPKEAEQGIFPKTKIVDGVRATVNITPLKMGSNDITIRFENQPEFNLVHVKFTMPPDSIIEDHAFSLGNGEYRLTGNLLHSAGVVQMEIKATSTNGEIITFPFEVRVPGVMP